MPPCMLGKHEIATVLRNYPPSPQKTVAPAHESDTPEPLTMREGSPDVL